MTIADLRSFVAIARRGGITAAAAELGLSQSGLSRLVARLEGELGHQLLARPRRSVVLTPAGRRFLLWAETTLDRYAAMARELSGEVPELAGPLRIVASTAPGEFLVPGLISSFSAVHPAVTAEVEIMDSQQVVEALLEGRVEIGFTGIRYSQRNLVYDVVASDEIVLAVPGDHPFAERGSIYLSELEGEVFIERENGSGTRRSFEAALARHHVALPPHRTVMVLTTTDAVVSAVQDGYGIGFVSSRAIRSRSTSQVALVRLNELKVQRSLYLVRDSDRQLGEIASSFVRWVLQHSG